MRQTAAIVLFASIATTSSALVLHPSAPIRRSYITPALHAVQDDYNGRPSYRRYGGGERKNRFSRNNNNSNYNTNNNEDDAYEMARKLASRRGLNLPIEQDPPANSYAEDYRDKPVYGSDYGGVAEQELPRIPMDYNANKNYNEGYGTSLKDLTWGGMKEQNNDNKYNDDRYEVRRSRGVGQSRFKTPQPPRQPPREVRPSDFRSRNNDSMSQRAQSPIGRRGDTERMRRMQQPRKPPNSRSSSSSTAYPFEVNRVNKLSELASTSERVDSPSRRPMMSQYPPPNAPPYRPSVPYQQPPPPFRPPSTLSGFSSTAEQMGRTGSMSSQFMPPPYVQQMPQYQQQRRQASNLRAPSIPLSQLALQPNIQPVDQPTSSSQQSQSFSAEFSQQQSQQMSGVYSDRRQPPPQQQPQSYHPGGQSQESFGGNPSASFSPLPFQQQSQADFTRPFQGGSESSQAQSSSPPNSSNQGAGIQPPPGFNGPPPPHPFDREGAPPPPPFDQGGPPPPPPFGPDVHIFQNPFMNEPSFQEQRTPTQQKPKEDGVKVPKDPNIEKRRRQAVSNSSNNNPGSGIKVPKDPLVERRRKEQQQHSNDGMKVPKDPNSRNQEVKVPKEPTMRNSRIERRPKEPRPKTSSNNTRIPREPKRNNAPRSEKVPKEPKRGVVDSKGDDLSYDDFASFFDMPRL